ncbi:uncharacterized protein METZ01_LOCUS291915, partial [marine metagenome]
MIISEKNTKNEEIINILDNLSHEMKENSQSEQDRFLSINPSEMEETVLIKLNH